jgi:CheY-like chemotaxis protein
MQSKCDILIVDDDRADLYLLERALRRVSASKAGIEVASDGRQALTLLEELEQRDNLPDVVALDISMPVLDGIGFLKLLRKSERFANLRTIVVTTSDAPKTHADAMSAGADGIVVKPQTETAISEVAEYLLNFCQTSKGVQHAGSEVGSFGPYGF